ncbi:MAG TPA: hypothetical protein VN923_17620, partial [Thermoanaerobaculia bacterium]|nr:hypothetical protein [Thermoanaerobaculia bacterium]
MDNRRLLLFFLISLAILLGWQWLMPSPKRPPVPARGAAAAAASGPAAPASSPPPQASAGRAAPAAAAAPPVGPPVAATAEQQVILDTEEFRAAFTNRGAQLVSFRIKEHRDEQGRPLELVRSRQAGPWPFGLVDKDLRATPLDDALFAVERRRDGEGHDEVRFAYRGAAGSARKVFRALGPGLLGLEVEASPPGWGLVLGPGVRNPSAKELGSKRAPRQVVYRVEGKVATIQAGAAEKLTTLPVGSLTWAGVEDNYF